MPDPAAVVGSTTGWEPFACERWRAERVRVASGLAVAPYVSADLGGGASAGGGGELVPPSFLSAQYVDAFALGVPDAPARLNGGNRCRWLDDVRVGDELERSSAVTSVQTKDGRTGRLEIYTIETTYRRAGAGPEVAKLGYTAIRRYPHEPAATSPAAGQPPKPPASEAGRPSDLPDGVVKVLTASVAPRDVVRYAVATEDLYEAHYDHAFARASGLPGTIVHGLLKMAWLARGALTFSGDGAVVRELSAAYRGMDLVGDDFTVWVAPDGMPVQTPDETADTPGVTSLRLYGQAPSGAVTTTGTAVIEKRNT